MSINVFFTQYAAQDSSSAALAEEEVGTGVVGEANMVLSERFVGKRE
jgi:hypothetical protein